MKVLHVVPSLEQGGAERLLRLLVEFAPPGREHVVATLLDRPVFERPPARIVSLGVRDRVGPGLPLSLARSLAALRRLVARERPSVVHGWLYYGNLLAGIAAPGLAPVLWSIHNTTFGERTRGMLRAVNWVCARASRRLPRRIVYCAESARRLHEAAGYDPRRSLTIPNGIDTAPYGFDAEKRRAARRELGLGPQTLAIGHFARFDAQKNVPMVLAAVAEAAREPLDLVLVMAGRDVTPANAELSSLVEAAGLSARVRLLGPRLDIDRLIAASDLVVLGSSFGEALPMVAVEALVGARPLVATDVGDLAELGLPEGHLVAPGDARAFAAAILRSARRAPPADAPARHWVDLAERTRLAFDIRTCAARYDALYREVAGA
jgi:glycosyltransferase involved in cell wall biosynthesis